MKIISKEETFQKVIKTSIINHKLWSQKLFIIEHYFIIFDIFDPQTFLLSDEKDFEDGNVKYLTL
jgi:hypothetical protein